MNSFNFGICMSHEPRAQSPEPRAQSPMAVGPFSTTKRRICQICQSANLPMCRDRVFCPAHRPPAHFRTYLRLPSGSGSGSQVAGTLSFGREGWIIEPALQARSSRSRDRDLTPPRKPAARFRQPSSAFLLLPLQPNQSRLITALFSSFLLPQQRKLCSSTR